MNSLLPGVSPLIVGCKTPAEVEENARIACKFAVRTAEQMRELEDRTRSTAGDFNFYKRPASIFAPRA